MRARAERGAAFRRGVSRLSELTLPFANVTPRPAVDSAVDWCFFILGGVAVVWLAWVLLQESFSFGWWQILAGVAFWVLTAYLVLPRLHRILTRIYVPGYFIGRARTSDGLLGDPVNLALLGEEGQLHEVMSTAGWTLADDLSLTTGWRIVRSTLARRSYLEAPVSPLMLFGRRQDFAYQQEVDGSPGKRHHVRFWRTPEEWMLPGGHHADWLAAGTYDRSVGLSLFTLQVTHKIDANTDIERDHIVKTVLDAGLPVTSHLIKDFSTGYHSRNGGGDSIVTDGDLPVLNLRKVPKRKSDAIPTDSRDRRPAPTAVGSLLILGRAVLAIVFALEVAFNSDAILGSVTGDVSPAVILPILIIVPILFGLFDALLAAMVAFGYNGPRVLAMSLSVISIVLQIVTVQTASPGVAAALNLPGIAFDALLILALSSERALVYARREHKARKRISGRPRHEAIF